MKKVTDGTAGYYDTAPNYTVERVERGKELRELGLQLGDAHAEIRRQAKEIEALKDKVARYTKYAIGADGEIEVLKAENEALVSMVSRESKALTDYAIHANTLASENARFRKALSQYSEDEILLTKESLIAYQANDIEALDYREPGQLGAAVQLGKIMNKSNVVTVQEDENGNLVLPLSDEQLAYLSLNQGDHIEWVDNNDGSFTLKKAVTVDSRSTLQYN